MPRRLVLALVVVAALFVLGAMLVNGSTPNLGVLQTATTHAYTPTPAGGEPTQGTLMPPSASTSPLRGDFQRVTVVRVVDGDTVKVASHELVRTVRILGVDTPETVKPHTPVQCYGPQASQETKRLLPPNTMATLRFEGPTEDHYHRLLAFVSTASGEDVSEQLASGGFARVYPMSSRYHVAETPRLLALQAAAKQRGVGLWGACA